MRGVLILFIRDMSIKHSSQHCISKEKMNRRWDTIKIISKLQYLSEQKIDNNKTHSSPETHYKTNWVSLTEVKVD